MTIEELIQKTKVFLLDMDGTIYIDETPIGEMKRRSPCFGKREKSWCIARTILPKLPKNTEKSSQK